MLAAVHLSYLLALLAGLVSFLSPCVFPLVPAYVAFLGGRVALPSAAAVGAAPGSGATDGAQHRQAVARARLLRNGAAFVAGFSSIFVLLFYVFSALDVTLLSAHRREVALVGGLLVIGLALQALGLVRVPPLMRERRPGWLVGDGGVPAFLLGVVFAAGWTPCVGPQLAAILTVASQGDFGGLPVMVAYCAGLAIPFLLIAALADRLQRPIRAINRHLGIVNLVSGGLLMLFGVLLVTDSLTVLNRFAAQSPFDL